MTYPKHEAVEVPDPGPVLQEVEAVDLLPVTLVDEELKPSLPGETETAVVLILSVDDGLLRHQIVWERFVTASDEWLKCSCVQVEVVDAEDSPDRSRIASAFRSSVSIWKCGCPSPGAMMCTGC